MKASADLGVGACSRCGTPCAVRSPSSADARMLRFAQRPDGLCANCAVTQWFVLHEELMRIGDLPDALLIKPIQEQFVRVMAASNADMRPDEIDWATVVKQWPLPWPQRQRRRR